MEMLVTRESYRCIFFYVDCMSIWNARANVDPGFKILREATKIIRNTIFPLSISVSLSRALLTGTSYYWFTYDNALKKFMVKTGIAPGSSNKAVQMTGTPIDFLLKHMRYKEKASRRDGREEFPVIIRSVLLNSMMPREWPYDTYRAITLYEKTGQRNGSNLANAISKAALTRAVYNARSNPYTHLGKTRLKRMFESTSSQWNQRKK